MSIKEVGKILFEQKLKPSGICQGLNLKKKDYVYAWIIKSMACSISINKYEYNIYITYTDAALWAVCEEWQ